MRTDYITTLPKKNRRGFTLVEIMVVVVIIGLIAALAFPSIWIAQKSATNSRFINDLRQMRRAFAVYSLENGNFPVETAAGVIPSGMESELNNLHWTEATPLGGSWDWEHNKNGFEAAVGVRGATVDAVEFAKIDARVDDGNLSTGLFQAAGGVYFFSVE